jgi:hypothetical protein
LVVKNGTLEILLTSGADVLRRDLILVERIS